MSWIGGRWSLHLEKQARKFSCAALYVNIQVSPITQRDHNDQARDDDTRIPAIASMNDLDMMMTLPKSSVPKRRRTAKSPYTPGVRSSTKTGLGFSTPQRQGSAPSPSALLAGIGSNVLFPGTAEPQVVHSIVLVCWCVGTYMCIVLSERSGGIGARVS